MREDERLKLLETVLEAHALLADAALELRRRLTRQSPLARTAARAERAVFRFKRELQRSELDEPPPPLARLLPEVRQGQQVIDIARLRPSKLPDEEA